MNDLAQTTIADLVTQHFRTAPVFKKHKIDFCCNGQRSVAEACETKGTDLAALKHELEQVIGEKKDPASPDFASWPLDLLADYIEKTHHRYVGQRLPEIVPFLDKLAKVHGGRHPELLQIRDLFTASAGDLTQHMKKEELILFPFIRKMVKAEQNGEALPSAHFGSVEHPVEMMRHEHETEGARFREIAALSSDYQPPADACNTYRVTFALLQEFENDLHHHIHLENNILFPRAIALEEKLSALA